MVKNKSRLAIKLFIIVWLVLAIHIALKLTFNYWQPYVIPNETLGAINTLSPKVTFAQSKIVRLWLE